MTGLGFFVGGKRSLERKQPFFKLYVGLGFVVFFGGGREVCHLMVNWWVWDSRVYLSSNTFHKGIPGIQITNPNQQFTIFIAGLEREQPFFKLYVGVLVKPCRYKSFLLVAGENSLPARSKDPIQKNTLLPWKLILLMEEIPNNHLGCIKPCRQWDIYYINWWSQHFWTIKRFFLPLKNDAWKAIL